MVTLETTQAVPLALDEDGTIRVGGTRITLETIVEEFKQGGTAEQIAQDYPSLSLSDIYCTIAYYLTHRESVEAYIREQIEAGAEIRRLLESRFPTTDLRERLRQLRVQGMSR